VFRGRLTDLPAGSLARALFDAIPDGVLVLDAAGRVLDANDALCSMLGYPREEIVGQDAPHPWWVDGLLPSGPRRISAGPREASVVLVRRDGTTTPATVRSVVIDDVRDSDAAAVVVVRRLSAAPGLPPGGND
jgi:PAS domain S-box-containing protein